MTDIGNAAAPEAVAETVAPPAPVEVDRTAEQAAKEKADAEAKAKPKPSIRDSIAKASKQVDADAPREVAARGDQKPAETAKGASETEAKAKAAVADQAQPEKGGQERDETGRFKAKDQPVEAAPTEQAKPEGAPAQQPDQRRQEAPARFDEAAKRDWDRAPETVRGAVARAIRELETGLAEHQKFREPLREYEEIARQNQTTIPDALNRYVSFDKLLNQDLVRGLEAVIRDKSGGQIGIREVAAHVMGQTPDQARQGRDQTIARLEAEVGDLRKQVGGVSQTMTAQTTEQIRAAVAAFATGKDDFEALSDGITKHINAGMTLEAAYEQARADAETLASALGFSRAPSQPPAQTRTNPALDAVAQTDAGQKSIKGAPGDGPERPSRQRSSSIREAVQRAVQAAG